MAARLVDDLESEFESDTRNKKKTRKDDVILQKHATTSGSTSKRLPHKSFFEQERDKEDGRTRQFHLLSLDAYSRHKLLVNHYLLGQGKGVENFTRDSSRDRNDYDVLQEEHKFIWDSHDEVDSWEKSLAKTYYDKLFKEYAIADLSRYAEKLMALRWRTEKEVVVGKGQFICGNKRCEETVDLTSWEVNFGYVEQGTKKNTLVKVRLCDPCSEKLNSCRKCRRAKQNKDHNRKRSKKKHKQHHKKKHRHSSKGDRNGSHSSASSSSSEDDGSEPRSSSDAPPQESQAHSVWTEPVQLAPDKPKEDQFDDYFKDMFL